MMNTSKRLIIIVFISGIYDVIGSDLTKSTFKICKQSLSNTDLNECLKDAMQDAISKLKDGLPELNLSKLHPLEIPSISIGEGKGAVNVVQNFKDVKLYNIPFAKVEKVDAKFNDTFILLDVDVTADEIRIEAIYSLDGKILLLPISGTGMSTIKFLNLKMSLQLFGYVIEKKDRHYFKISNVTLEIIPSRIHFKLDNLFNGDERLGNETNKVFNENWMEIWTDVKNQYFYALGVIIQDYADKLFKSTPVEELFPLK